MIIISLALYYYYVNYFIEFEWYSFDLMFVFVCYVNRLKQRFPWAFHDICLFSDVCNVLSSYGYRLRARRFLHELFMDSPFDEVNSLSLVLSQFISCQHFAFFTSNLVNILDFSAQKLSKIWFFRSKLVETGQNSQKFVKI